MEFNSGFKGLKSALEEVGGQNHTQTLVIYTIHNQRDYIVKREGVV